MRENAFGMHNLNREQTDAVVQLTEWHEACEVGRRELQYILTGGAGTGKTTTVSAFLEYMGWSEDDYAVLAPTAKAAQVLIHKGVRHAQTVHSFLYTPKTKMVCRQTCSNRACEHHRSKYLSFDLKNAGERGDLKCIIVDEASMLLKAHYDDLWKCEIPLLLVGDPYQLPPVDKEERTAGLKLLQRPDLHLTEIMRQKNGKKSPIIQYAQLALSGDTRVREEFLPDVEVKNVLEPEDLLKVGQVICYKNETRQRLNHFIRHVKGYTSRFPQPGERLLCKNNTKYKIKSDNRKFDIRLVNGLAGVSLGNMAKEDGGRVAKYYPLLFRPDNCTNCFSIDNWNTDFMLNEMPSSDSTDVMMTYGYALTCHAAQGSEYDTVAVVMDIPLWGGKVNAQGKNWIYTAVTRAKEKLILIPERTFDIFNARWGHVLPKRFRA